MVQMEAEMFDGGGVSGLQPSYITQNFDPQNFSDALMQIKEIDPLSIGIDHSDLENELNTCYEYPRTFPAQEASDSHVYAGSEHNFYTSHGLLTTTNLKEPSHSNSVELESGAGSTAKQWLSESISNQPQQAFDNIFATQEDISKVLDDFFSATPFISVHTQFQVIFAS